jgi:hypothetical protein
MSQACDGEYNGICTRSNHAFVWNSHLRLNIQTMPAECSVCLDPFDDASHRPTALTCGMFMLQLYSPLYMTLSSPPTEGHVHCFACTTTWFKGHATCPTCNHKFTSPVPVIRLFLPLDKSHEQFSELARRVERLEGTSPLLVLTFILIFGPQRKRKLHAIQSIPY